MPALIQCGFEKQTAQYMEPKNTPEINENTIQSDLITFSFVTVSLDHPVTQHSPTSSPHSKSSCTSMCAQVCCSFLLPPALQRKRAIFEEHPPGVCNMSNPYRY